MRVLMRDVSAKREPDDVNALITHRGDPLDDTMMLKLEACFEAAQRVGDDLDGNKAALLHKPCVVLVAAAKGD